MLPAARDEKTFETIVNVAVAETFNVAVSEHETVPFVPAAGVVHDHPAGADSETNVVDAESGRSAVAAMPVLGPLLVTVIVHVRFAPALTGFGDAASAMRKSDCLETITSIFALLSLASGSGVVLLIVAVVLKVPEAVGGVEAVMVKEAVPGASSGVVQVMVGAIVPGATELHDQPAGTTSDWNKTPEGSGKVSTIFDASAGPSLLTLTT
jgi:hypothetical protein